MIAMTAKSIVVYGLSFACLAGFIWMVKPRR